MRRRRSWRWALALAVVFVAIIGFLGGNWYLRREVTLQLIALNGASVTVDEVAVGIRRHRIRGVRLYQSTDDNQAWVQIERLDVALPIWQALLGQTRPSRVDLAGVVTRLRLDEHGTLLTRLPGADGELRLPADTIAVRDARVEILRPSRPPVVADTIQAEAQEDGDEINVTGMVGHALGAQWSFDAAASTVTNEVSGHLKTQSLRVTTNQLVAEGLLPTEALRGLRAETVTAIQLDFHHVPNAPLHYHVELSPASLGVQLDQFAWNMTGGAGSMVIEDGFVRVHEMSGTTLGGELALRGQADLRQRPWRGQISITARDVTPPAGLLPDDAMDLALGKSSGEADFEVTLRPEQLDVTGEGEGTIHGASLLGILPEPIPWQVSFGFLHSESSSSLSGTLRLDASVRDVDVHDVLRRLAMPAEQLAATASATGTLRIPLESVNDPRTYHFTADLQCPQATVAGTEARDISLSCSYDRGRINVRDLSAQFTGGGQLSGQIHADLNPGGEIDGQIDFDAVPNSMFADMLLSSHAEITGASQGRCAVHVPTSRWRDVRAWTGSGNVACQALQVDDVKLADITTQFGLRDGRLELEEGSVAWHEASLLVRGSIDFLAPHQFDGRVQIRGIDLEAIAKRNDASLPISLNGSGELEGDIRGKLTPFTWNANGSGRLPDFLIANRNVEKTQFRWRADPAGLDVHDLTANALGGQVNVTAKLPLDGTGGSRLQGSFENLDASQLRDLIPAVKLVLGGRISGQVDLTNMGTPTDRVAELQFRGANLIAYDVPLKEIDGTAAYRASRADFDVVGKTLGGTVGFQGHMALDATESTAVRLDGRVEMKEIRLAQVWSLVQAQHQLRNLRALVEGELDVQLVGDSYEPRAQGHLYLRQPSWGSAELASLAEADVDLRGQNLRVTKVACRAAGGMVTGDLTMRIGKHSTGSFAVGLERVALDKLTTMLGGPRRSLEGTVDAAITGRVRSDWEGKAVLRLTNAKLAGVPVSSLTTPINWAFAPSSGRARAKAKLNSAKVAGGRVSGDLDLRWTGRLGIDANANFDSLHVQPMARALPLVSDQLQGKLSGTLDVEGSSIRSVDDLSGSFQGSLKQSQALLIPVLQALTSSLGLGDSSSKMFSETAVRGHFSRGVIHVDRMTMNSNDVRMYITGKMSTRGNLDLDVTADVPQVSVAAIAIGVLRPVDLLRRRLLFLKLDGSVRSPIVRIRTAEFIQQELILFFWPFAMTP